MRGKHIFWAVYSLQLRITPAGAGKTRELEVNFVRCQDHPRRCGENRKRTVLYVIDTGSPPQVRGKLYVGVICIGDGGITPAGAGKTKEKQPKQPPRKDHPRRCGENASSVFIPALLPGSPPQVRGKLCGKSKQNAPFGITPAGAGKTISASFVSIGIKGSPPQVRGKLGKRIGNAVFSGITPAGAGKTQVLANGGNTDEDHPRRCGENFHPLRSELATLGSPPQVRGKLFNGFTQ